MLLRKSNQLLIEFIRRTHADRIERIRNDHIFCFFQRFLRNAVQIRHISVLLLDRIVTDVRLCHNTAHLEHRITRVRDQDHIPRIAEYKADMSHCLLGAVYRHHLVRTDIHVETLFISILHRRQKLRQVCKRVFIILRVCTGILHGLHYMRSRLEIRRANGQIIYFTPFFDQLFLFLIQSSEDALLKIIDHT